MRQSLVFRKVIFDNLCSKVNLCLKKSAWALVILILGFESVVKWQSSEQD